MGLRISGFFQKLFLGYNKRAADVVGKGLASYSKIVTTFTGRVDINRLKQILGNTPHAISVITKLEKLGLLIARIL